MGAGKSASHDVAGNPKDQSTQIWHRVPVSRDSQSTRLNFRQGQLRFTHLRLRLLQPKRHVHVAVHRRRGGEVVAGLIPFARAQVDLAETEVAVGDEGARPEPLGEGQRLARGVPPAVGMPDRGGTIRTGRLGIGKARPQSLNLGRLSNNLAQN
jgi:hypothetical protein